MIAELKPLLLPPLIGSSQGLDPEGFVRYPFNPFVDIPEHPSVTLQEQHHAQRIARAQLMQETETRWLAANRESQRLDSKIFVRRKTVQAARERLQTAENDYNDLSSVVGWFFDFRSNGSFTIQGRQLSNDPTINGQPIRLTRIFPDGREVLGARLPSGAMAPELARKIHHTYSRQIAAGRKIYERSFSLAGRVGPASTSLGARR